MSSAGVRQKLEILFTETGGAHHKAFSATNGEDADWPGWYARFVTERLNVWLGTRFTEAQVADLLVEAENGRKSAGVSNWPGYYADFFLKKLAKV